MKTETLQQLFNGHTLTEEFTLLNTFQDQHPDYAEGFRLIYDDKSGIASWSSDPAFLDRLMPFAQANCSGSIYALWDEPDAGRPLNKMPVVVFGDEGGCHVVAENMAQLMRLLTCDTEISVDEEEAYFYKYDEEEMSEHAATFKHWLAVHFQLPAIPDPAALVQQAQQKHKEAFDRWMAGYYTV